VRIIVSTGSLEEHERTEQDAGPNDEERGQPHVPSRASLARSSSSVSFAFGVSVNHIVTSRFSVSSHRLDFGVLQELLPWRVVETAPASDTVEFAVAVFDLGIGQHDRVDEHLVVAKAALLSHAAKLDSLRGVGGGMKAGENGRFETPSSSAWIFFPNSG
jgi:hypothetical protein